MTKNRFDGTLGKVFLDFDPDSLTMSSYQSKNSSLVPSRKENKFLRSVKPSKTYFGGKRGGQTKDNNESFKIPSEIEPGKENSTHQYIHEVGESKTCSVEERLKDSKNENQKFKALQITVNDKNTTTKSQNKMALPKNRLSGSSLKEPYATERSDKAKYEIKDGVTFQSNSENKNDDTNRKNLHENSVRTAKSLVKVERNDNPNGTILKSKATRFSAAGQLSRRSLTSKKISVKQLDINKVYLQ